MTTGECADNDAKLHWIGHFHDHGRGASVVGGDVVPTTPQLSNPGLGEVKTIASK